MIDRNGYLYEDSHAHLPSLSDRAEQIFLSEKIQAVLVNTSRESEFASAKKLCAADSRLKAFFGIHPWYIPESESEIADLLKHVSFVIQDNPDAGIGECGLDFSPKYKDSKLLQLEVFSKQVEIACSENRSLSIHCVKAWNSLFSILQLHSKRLRPFIMHSFYGSIETAERLIRLNAYISLSASSFRNPQKSCNIIRQLPLERILIETDAALGLDKFSSERHFMELSSNYRKLSEILSLDEHFLQRRISSNGKIFTDRNTSRQL